jgi:hypothetical protein
VIITVPIKLVSLANARMHWRKRAALAKEQRRSTRLVLRPDRVYGVDIPCVVTITRIAPRQLDDDNLAISGKHVRDEIAAWLGADDKPGSGIEWRYGQRKGEPGEYACEIRIEPTKEAA